MKEIIKTVVILSVIALIAGALLGLVSHFTQIDETEALAAKIKKTGIYSGETPLTLLEYQDSWGEYAGGRINNVFFAEDIFIVHSVGHNGYKGDVELLINITEDKITNIVVYKAEETPGLGTKAFNEKYTAQFFDKDIKDLDGFVIAKKAVENNQITAITGVTKSSNAVLNAVNVAVAWYKEYTEVNG